ncbi:LacI family DNA-binding transcriptional regulator [Microbacterium sp. B2969]|uniref:LacI family DNA-binding transcriptional regulator n=1 Tax=Microbacterium alkaliflavum TaxID=3248839 RepID=A0ABW7QDY2_9MICO
MTGRRSSTATMHQVAAAAGVSQATVSLVLNNTGGSRVAESTRLRVLDAARTLGYRPNAAARTLRDGTAGLIGFVGDVVASSPFAGRIVEGAQARAWEDGLLLLTVNTGGDAGIEDAAIEALLSHQVAGIVYASMYHRKLTIPDSLIDVPTVVLNSEDAAGLARSIVPDEVGGGLAATQALLDAGHRRIGLINIESPSSGLPAAVGRAQGYREALDAAGLDVDPRLVWDGDGNPQAGFDGTLALMALEAPPTAIFCANDRTAWGAYQALETLGLAVPEDVSIIGFDNQETLAPFLRPGLTTLELPFVTMGWRAVDTLLNDSAQPDGPEQVSCPLVVRESVARPNRTAG